MRASFDTDDVSNINTVVKGVRIAQGYSNRKDRILIIILSLFGLCENLNEILAILEQPTFVKYSKKMVKTDEEKSTLLGSMEKFTSQFPAKSLYVPVILRVKNIFRSVFLFERID